MLKGKDKYETLENYSILSIIFGVVLLSFGVAMTAFSPKGISAVLAMLGSLITFLSTIALVFIWMIKEFKGE